MSNEEPLELRAPANHLGLDIATKTGYAYSLGGARNSGWWDSSASPRESRNMVYLHFRTRLLELLEAVAPDLVIIEQAIKRGGASTEVLMGLHGVARATIAEKCPLALVTTLPPATLRKWATGKGRGKKKDMMRVVNERWGGLYPGGSTASEDEADARALLEYAIEKYGGAR